MSGSAGNTDKDSGRRRPKPRGSQTTRGDLPRRLGEVLAPALDRLATGEEARAYSAWARAVGEPVTGGTRPKAFRRGQLTIECASSVWANELTYLGPQIMRRMDEVAPGHPVRRFRFIVGRLPAPASADRGPAAAAPEVSSGQGSGGPATREQGRRQHADPPTSDATRVHAEGVGDERLRAAIEAALQRSAKEPPGGPGRGASPG